jgi:hypothetical protein
MGGEVIGRPDLDLTHIDNHPFQMVREGRKVLKKDNYHQDYINQFTNDAESGDYAHTVEVLNRYFNVIGLKGAAPF